MTTRKSSIFIASISAVVVFMATNSAFARNMSIDKKTAIDYPTAIDSATQIGEPAPQLQLAQVFQEQGQVWTTVKLVPRTADAIRSIFIPFKINIGDGAQWYWACMSENGVLWLETAVSEQVCPLTMSHAATSLQRRNFIAADFSDLRNGADDAQDLYGSALFSTGIVDYTAPYRIDEGREAAIFTWTETPVTRGLHGFRLGPSRYTVPAANASTQDHFCFRGGRALTRCGRDNDEP